MPLSNNDFTCIYNQTAKKLYNMLANVFKSTDEAVSILNETFVAIAAAEEADESTVYKTAAALSLKRLSVPTPTDYASHVLEPFFTTCEQFDAYVSPEAADASDALLDYFEPVDTFNLLVLYLRMYCEMSIDDIAQIFETDNNTAKCILVDSYRSFMTDAAATTKEDPVLNRFPLLQLFHIALVNQKEAVFSDDTYNDFFDYTFSQLTADEAEEEIPLEEKTAEEIVEALFVEEVAEELPVEEAAEEIVEELPAEEAAEEIVEEIAAEEVAEEIVEEIAAEEVAEEIVEEIAAEEATEEIIEEIAAEEVAEEIIEEIADEEAAEEIAEEIADEEVAEETEEELPVEEDEDDEEDFDDLDDYDDDDEDDEDKPVSNVKIETIDDAPTKFTFNDSPEWSRLKSIFRFTASFENNMKLSRAFELILDGQFDPAQKILNSLKNSCGGPAVYLGLLMVDVQARSIDELLFVRTNFRTMDNFIAADSCADVELKDFLSRIATKADVAMASAPAPVPEEKPAKKGKKKSGTVAIVIISILLVIAAVAAVAIFGLGIDVKDYIPALKEETVATTEAPVLPVMTKTASYKVKLNGDQPTQIEFRPLQGGYYGFRSKDNNVNVAIKLLDKNGNVIDEDRNSVGMTEFLAITQCNSGSSVIVSIYSERPLQMQEQISFTVYALSDAEAEATMKYREFAQSGVTLTADDKLHIVHDKKSQAYRYPTGAKAMPVDFYIDQADNTLWLAFNATISGSAGTLWYPVELEEKEQETTTKPETTKPQTTKPSTTKPETTKPQTTA